MRTTITINDNLFKTLKKHAIDSDQTMSEYIEDAIKYQLLEDLEDLEDIKARENESTESYDELVASLKADGLL
jgi:metal-responsive CopG/Arc/MetJ family transcriptional regulator